MEVGVSFLQATGEADVQIANIESTLAHPTLVISGDSDLLWCKNAQFVAIPLKKGKSFQFAVYDKNDISTTLDINRTQMLALAIVSTNDYRKSVYGYSISRNLKVIKDLEEKANLRFIINQYANVMGLKTVKERR